MSPEEVAKQFCEREGAYNDKFRLNTILVPHGTLKGRTLLEIVPNFSKACPEQPFRFSDLPTELKVRIYGYVLILGETGCVTLDTHNWWSSDFRRSRQKCVTKGFKRTDKSPWHKGLKWEEQEAKWVGGEPSPFSLLLVNKEINAEATPIAYGSNCFDIKSYPIARSFAKTIGANLKHLTMIRLRACSLTTFDQALRALFGADGLRRMYLSDSFVLEVLRSEAQDREDVSSWAEVLDHAVRGLLLVAQATNRAKGRKWRALDIIQLRREKRYRLEDVEQVEEKRQDREKLQAFRQAFRKRANAYLREE
ncbi:uncharacterized protein MYCFIDRAFT_88756 [Pseudocercospora fijiensis CIRAD86]|uniref:Uncharacterized protein n=1 Tax=Pseudocercospora fijiensis (strain CIRAD86) TaxID=383855 RepID=M2Z6E6_PSEFD|nr:uncharacterized protein MYCFIDRAFT_88756 [Pseudocercospora fijiensis CIRAD86]EME85340.1 hypothetical protein MYCFIDRAFT_88756 [Pseudocercospora fijiensis CIRAD86]